MRNEPKRADGRGHRGEGGIEAAERELGLKRMEGRRAVAVSSLPEEAKQAARDSGLDDHQSALLAAAKEMKDHGPEAAVAKIKEIADRQSRPSQARAGRKSKRLPVPEAGAEFRQAQDDPDTDFAMFLCAYVPSGKIEHLLSLYEKANKQNAMREIRRLCEGRGGGTKISLRIA